jgi:hypothetical protein
MKKFSIILLIALVAMFSFGPALNAQTSIKNGQTFNKEAIVNSLNVTSDADKLAMENMKATNSRMYSDFSKHFKNATDIKSSQIKNSTLISCNMDGKLTRVLYNKNGKWQHTITTYESDKLAESIRDQVSDAFPRYSIFGGVIEVEAGNKKAHFVTIENKSSWKRIRVVDGEMDVYEEFQKQ